MKINSLEQSFPVPGKSFPARLCKINTLRHLFPDSRRIVPGNFGVRDRYCAFPHGFAIPGTSDASTCFYRKACGNARFCNLLKSFTSYWGGMGVYIYIPPPTPPDRKPNRREGFSSDHINHTHTTALQIPAACPGNGGSAILGCPQSLGGATPTPAPMPAAQVRSRLMAMDKSQVMRNMPGPVPIYLGGISR
jgi:hypothetical protein